MADYCIVNKQTQKLWVTGSGTSFWKSKKAAKIAFANSKEILKEDPLLASFFLYKAPFTILYFDNQDVYEILEIKNEKEVYADKVEQTLQKLNLKLIEMKANMDYDIATQESYDQLYGDIEYMQYLLLEVSKQ